MNSPLVSIITPAFNAASYIDEAVASVINQTYDNWELIIVDDGSVDSTVQVLEKYLSYENINLFFHDGKMNRGVSHSRALGVSRAKGEYLAFLDADDVFKDAKIEKQVLILEQHPDVHLCHSNIWIKSEEETYPTILDVHFDRGHAVNYYSHGEEAGFMISNHICNSSVMVRKRTLENINIGMNQLFQIEDWVLWVLVSEFGRFVYLPDKLSGYRYHAASSTAKSQSNVLERQYSKIELYMGIISRTKSQICKDVGVRELKKAISDIYGSYSDQLIDGSVGSPIDDLFKGEGVEKL